MKISPAQILVLFAIIISCERNDPESYSNPILKIGNNAEFTYEDFELYDSSAKVLYFSSAHPEFVNYKESEFSFFADTVFIYKGRFWSALSSSFPTTPFVACDPFFYLQNHAIGIEYLNQNQPDPRNDSRLMSAFKENNLLHSGLSVTIESLSFSGAQATFSCVVTNHDRDDLYILDYKKMGVNLFHFYTNGLVLVNKDQPAIVYCIIHSESPVPYNSWRMDWFSLLKSGESHQINIDYSFESPLQKGNYIAYFEFPGLAYQISKDDVRQINGRIWLGSVTASKKIVIQ